MAEALPLVDETSVVDDTTTVVTEVEVERTLLEPETTEEVTGDVLTVVEEATEEVAGAVGTVVGAVQVLYFDTT